MLVAEEVELPLESTTRGILKILSGLCEVARSPDRRGEPTGAREELEEAVAAVARVDRRSRRLGLQG
eukprot:3619609-Heterocapsa_arctica.AAC.1